MAVLTNLDIGTGKLVKLRFIACTDTDCNTPAPLPPFEVMFNPTTFTEKHETEFEPNTTPGNISAPQAFKKAKPQEYSFEFILDGTGAIDIQHRAITVDERLENLKKVIYEYNGDKHRPNNVKIWYGAFLYKGVCKSLDIVYTLFDNLGTPLRAKVNVQFVASMSLELSERIKKKNSPDVTHIRIFKDHNTFLGMCNDIYERNDLFIEVARSNDLNTFRRVNTGKELHFVPISKEQ